MTLSLAPLARSQAPISPLPRALLQRCEGKHGSGGPDCDCHKDTLQRTATTTSRPLPLPSRAISRPDDASEIEAERLARQVLAGPVPVGAQPTDGSLVQRRASAPTVPDVPPIVNDVLRSSGQPLDPASRAFFEPRLGQDLGHVRVHTGQQAAASASAVHAEAYTVGSDVVLGTGGPSPRLLAHELAHVAGQGDAADVGRTRRRSEPALPGLRREPRLQRMPIAVAGSHDGAGLTRRASVGTGGTNHRAEVEVVADRLHDVAFLSNEQFAVVARAYARLNRDDPVPEAGLTILFERLTALDAGTPSGIDPATAQARFGVRLTEAVGPGWANVPTDVELLGLSLQYAGFIRDGAITLESVLSGLTAWRMQVVRGSWGPGRLAAASQLGLRGPVLPSTVRERAGGDADPGTRAQGLREVVSLRARARAFSGASGVGIDEAEFYLRIRGPALELERDHGVPHIFTLAHAGIETGWDPYPRSEIVFGITRAAGAPQTMEPTFEEVTAGSAAQAEAVARRVPGWRFVSVLGQKSPGRWNVRVERSFARARDPRHALELYFGVLQQRNFRAALGRAGDLNQMADDIERGGWATASNYAGSLKAAIARVQRIETAFVAFEAAASHAGDRK